MKLPLLFNPRSGPNGKNPEALLARLPGAIRERIELAPLGPPWELHPFIDQAIAAGGPLLVWGGDGTIHHAGRALVERGCPIALAAIPGGSGNGLVRGLRTPLEAAGALVNLLQGRELRMDLPRLDGVPFLNLCGTGFEAEVAHRFEALQGRGLGNYARLCLKLWRQQPELALRWEAELPEGAEPAGRMDRIRAAWRGPEPLLPERAWSLCFANLPQYGSGLWIAPDADPRDGLLHWARLHRPGPLDLIFEVPQLFREGGRTPLRQQGRIRQTTLHVDRSCPWHLDGEPVPARDRAELTLEPLAFRMQVSSACPWT